MSTVITKALIPLGAACAISVVASPIAAAASSTVSTPPSGMTQAATTSASMAAHSSLAQAFTTSNAEREGKNPNALLGGTTAQNGSPVAVYVLSPSFVKTGSGPVGVFGYAASAYTINGTPATIDTIYKHGTWKSVNIATGQDEQSYARAASGSPLLYEPQVHAWYAIKGSTLSALNTSAKKAIGANSISVKDYAVQVHAKYAAFLPGSTYDKQGSAGGFKDAPAPSNSHGSTKTETEAATAGAVGLAALGAGVLRRRRVRE